MMPTPEQLTVLKITLLLEASGGKLYEAPWLEGGKKVWRNAKGQFGKVASEIKEQLDPSDGGETENEGEQGLASRWAAKIKALHPKRALNDKLLSVANSALEYAISRDPEFADDVAEKLFGKSAQALREDVADRYAQLHPELANAIKQNPFKEIQGDLERILAGGDRQGDAKLLAQDIGHAIHWAGVKYDKTLDDLNSLDGPPAVKALGKAAAIAIPVSVYLSATLTPELAVGLLVGDGLASILAGAAAGQAASLATRKALDAAHVDNPWLRIGADLVAGTAAAGAVSAGIHAWKPSKALDAMRSVDDLARSDLADAGREVTRVSGRAAKKVARINEKAEVIVDHAEDFIADFSQKYPQLGMDSRDLEGRQQLLQQGLQAAWKKKRLKYAFDGEAMESFAKAAVQLAKKHLDPLVLSARHADPQYLPGLKKAQRSWKANPKSAIAKIKERTPGYERFSPKVADRLEVLEHRIRNEATEEMHLIDADSGELLNRLPGEVDQVKITRGEIPEGRNVIVTHNHPSSGDRIRGGVLSPQDIHSAVAMGAQEIRATAKEGVYSLRRRDGKPLSVVDDIKLFDVVNKAFQRNAEDAMFIHRAFMDLRPDVKTAFSWSKHDPDIVKVFGDKYAERVEQALSSVRFNGLEIVLERNKDYVAKFHPKGGELKSELQEVENQLHQIYDDFFAEAYGMAAKKVDRSRLKFRPAIKFAPVEAQ